jgi:hypothetical protein
VKGGKVTPALDLEGIERKTYISYHQDGLMDIVVGLFILAFGLEMLVETGFAVYMPIALIALFWLGKRKLTYPRMGFVRFSPERTKMKKTVAVMKGALLLILLAALAAFLALPGSQDYFRQYAFLIFGVLGASIMSLAAFRFEYRRLYAYAALTLITFLTGRMLDLRHALYIVPLGAVVLICGLWMLIRFMRMFPISAEGEGR